MRLGIAITIGAFLGSALVADTGLGQAVVSQPERHAGFAGQPPHVLAYYGKGVATDSQLHDAVGDVRFFVTACKNSSDGLQVRREITVGIDKPHYENPGVIDALLFAGAVHAWEECPLHFIDVVTGQAQPGYRGEITAVHVFYNGTEVVTAANLCCDGINITGFDYYRWGRVDDVGAVAREEAARQQSLEESRKARDERYKTREERSAEFWGSVGSFFEFIFAGLGCYGLWLVRIPIARWYYFAFYPHPATNLVQTAISQGATPLNSKALASAIGELPSGSQILRQVRIEQGENLVALMQEATRERLARYKKQTKYEYERAAIVSIQEAIGLAAIALERAKASFAASQNVGG